MLEASYVYGSGAEMAGAAVDRDDDDAAVTATRSSTDV